MAERIQTALVVEHTAVRPRAHARRCVCCRQVYALVIVVAAMLLGASPAIGEYTRTFERTLPWASGFAVNGAGDLITSHVTGQNAQEFKTQLQVRSPAFEPTTPNNLIAEKAFGAVNNAEDLAIEYGGGQVYAAGGLPDAHYGEVERINETTGELLERWANTDEGVTGVAVDNSTEPLQDPSACTALGNCIVYVAKKGVVGTAGRIEKFDSNGEPQPWAGSSACITGNTLAGAPNESGAGCSDVFGYSTPQSLAVDARGDIFTIAERAGPNESPAVLEYAATGAVIKIFTGAETPGTGGSVEYGGWGGQLENVAVDLTSDHLLVSVTRYTSDSVPIEGAVDEFDVGSGQYLSQITTTSNGARLASADKLATDSAGDIYVGDPTAEDIVVYSPGRFLPSVRLGEAHTLSATDVVLHGEANPESAINPENSGLGQCDFEYVTAAAYRQNVESHGGSEAEGFADLSSGGEVPCTPEARAIPARSSWYPVEAKIIGLQSGTSYRYRLVAATAGALGGVANTMALQFVAPHAPAILAMKVDGLTSVSAQFSATINPLGASTSYQFEYVAQPEYERSGYADAVTTPTQNIGMGGLSGSSEEQVLQVINDLSSGTRYEVRIDASNAYGLTYGATISFQTLATGQAGPPDSRAYELVTPVNKEGGSDMFAESETNKEYFDAANDVEVAASGQELLLQTKSAFGPFPFAGEGAYVFRRAAPGRWSYTSASSPQLGVQSVRDVIVNPLNFWDVAFTDFAGAAAGVEGAVSDTLVGQAGGPYAILHSDLPTHSGHMVHTELVGASADLGAIVLAGRDPSLCPGAESLDANASVLCEWRETAERTGNAAETTLELLSVNADGALLSKCGAVVGAGGKEVPGATYRAVSADGARVFFTAPDPEMRYDSETAQAATETAECWNGATRDAPQVYARAEGATVELSAPEEGVKDPTGRHRAEYIGASEDGANVFFITEGWLTRDHPTKHDRELYECEMTTGGAEEPPCRLTRVSAGEPNASGYEAGADVYNVPAISASGAVVYFTAFNALAPGATTRTPSETLVNLYRYDAVRGHISYVATVNTYDNPAAGTFCKNICPEANWYTTPDGNYLLFATTQELTGYPTAGPCATLPDNGGNGDGHCDELYRYDAASAEAGEQAIVCVSCDPSGAGPTSNAQFARSAISESESGPVRAMSNDGSYVFFDSADPLVPQATNGTLNVYEWHDGTIALINAGSGLGPSYFLGTSASGGDVFFGTHDKLVSQDTGSEGDIYDARICTSAEPCMRASGEEAAQCEGDACQSPPPAPIDVAPVSATFSGPGNESMDTGHRSIRSRGNKPRTRTERLKRAVRRCDKKHGMRARRGCRLRARRRYGGAPEHSPPSGRQGRAKPRASRVRSYGRSGR